MWQSSPIKWVSIDFVKNVNGQDLFLPRLSSMQDLDWGMSSELIEPGLVGLCAYCCLHAMLAEAVELAQRPCGLQGWNSHHLILEEKSDQCLN